MVIYKQKMYPGIHSNFKLFEKVLNNNNKITINILLQLNLWLLQAYLQSPHILF